MKYSKSNKNQYLSLISKGGFYFEGRNDYKTKLLVYAKSNGANRIGSHIPAEWLPLPVIIEEATPKRRLERGERGPGKRDYSSNKNANQVTKMISENVFKIIDELLVGYNNTKINQIIEGLIVRMRKCYNVYESKNKKENINDKIVESLKTYLTGLQEHGNRFTQVETMINTVLSSVSFKESNNTEIAELLNVHRKRIGRCKKRRRYFNSVIDKASGSTKEKDTMQSSDESIIDEYTADFGSSFESSDVDSILSEFFFGEC